MNKKETYNYIVEQLKNDTDAISQMVSVCNSWDGSLEDYYYWENDEEFFNTFFEGKPMEAVRACYFGDYTYSDEYVQFNAYGNLDSCENYEYEEILQDNVEEILDKFLELAEENKIKVDDIYGDIVLVNLLKEYIEGVEDDEQ